MLNILKNDPINNLRMMLRNLDNEYLEFDNANKNFVKMLYDIQRNNELLEVFVEQSLIWWNKKDLMDLIKIVKKFINKNSIRSCFKNEELLNGCLFEII